MCLDIENPPGAPPMGPHPPVPHRRRREASNREPEPILYMRDVVAICRKHRSTIYRWIDRNWFPPPNVPAERPIGWLRSTLEEWQRSGRTSPKGFLSESREQTNEVPQLVANGDRPNE